MMLFQLPLLKLLSKLIKAILPTRAILLIQDIQIIKDIPQIKDILQTKDMLQTNPKALSPLGMFNIMQPHHPLALKQLFNCQLSLILGIQNMLSLLTSTTSPAADAHLLGQISLALILDVLQSVGQSVCTASLGFFVFGFPQQQIVARILSSAVADVEIGKPQSRNLVVDIHKQIATVVYKFNNFFTIFEGIITNFFSKRHMDDQKLNTTHKPLLQENSYPIVEEGPSLQPFQQINKKPTNNLNQGIQPQHSSSDQKNLGKPNKDQNSFQLGPYQSHVQKNQLKPRKDQSTLPKLILPSYITPQHDFYKWIIEQCKLPCRYCKSTDSQVIMRAGLVSWSWCMCLAMFCCILVFICCPLNDDKYKNVIIKCLGCKKMKAKVQKSCWGSDRQRLH